MIYPVILTVHNALRWLVLGSLLVSLAGAYSGWISPRPYRPADQTLRIITTSIAHTQLLLGVYLYTISPIVSYYWKFRPGMDAVEFPFFGLIHGSLMFVAITIMTVGSSKAKRQADARLRFRTTAVYFTISLVLILIAVPWPFSPLATRPLLRTF